MKSPLIPGTQVAAWSVVHEDGSVSRGYGGKVAFTTRRAYSSWVQGTVDVPFAMGDPSRTEPALFTPNRYLLILEEAWGWKFPGECPQMPTVDVGRNVLKRLQGGTINPRQKLLKEAGWMGNLLFHEKDPDKLACLIFMVRMEYEAYRRLAEWVPDIVTDSWGQLSSVSHQVVMTRCGEMSRVRGVTIGGFPKNTEFMIIPDFSVIPRSWQTPWKTRKTPRKAPDYLSVLP